MEGSGYVHIITDPDTGDPNNYGSYGYGTLVLVICKFIGLQTRLVYTLIIRVRTRRVWRHIDATWENSQILQHATDNSARLFNINNTFRILQRLTRLYHHSLSFTLVDQLVFQEIFKAHARHCCAECTLHSLPRGVAEKRGGGGCYGCYLRFENSEI